MARRPDTGVPRAVCGECGRTVTRWTVMLARPRFGSRSAQRVKFCHPCAASPATVLAETHHLRPVDHDRRA